MSTRRLHGAWYAMTALPIAAAILLIVQTVYGHVDDYRGLRRVRAPGTTTATLRAGTAVIYGENVTVIDGRRWEGTTTGTCTLRDERGAELALTALTKGQHYQLTEFRGDQRWKTVVPADGTYQLACDGTGVFAVGPDIMRALLRGILYRFVGGLAVAALVALAIAVARRRRTA